MKNFKIIFFFVAFLVAGTVFTSCGDGTSKSTETEQQGKEYTSAYVCPMHCKESGSDTAGKCPVCGMDYVKNENYDAGEDQSDNHEGHNH